MRGEIISREEMLAIPAEEISDLSRLPSEPLVSVIVITYNHEDFIKDCLEGILMQRCDFPIEVIVGEDKSTDNTLEICLDYQKRYPHFFRVLTWQENLGPNANFLRCWGRARGKYVAICEGDDYWIDPDKLAKQVAVMYQYPSARICGARVRVISNSKIEEFGPKKIKKFYNLGDVLENYIFHTSTYLFRSDNINLPQETYSIKYLDYFLQILFALKGNLICLQEIVSVYRHHPGGISVGSSRLQHSKMIIEVYKKVYPYLDSYHKRLTKRKINVILTFFYHQLIESEKIICVRLEALKACFRILLFDPLRSILLLFHILMPNLYRKARIYSRKKLFIYSWLNK